MIFLQLKHRTFTPSPSSLSNFLEPHSGQIGHALAEFIEECHFQLFGRYWIQVLVKRRHHQALQ